MALNLPRLESPRFYAIHPSTGRPVSFGTVTFYVAGTTTLKTVYSTREGAIGQNPTGLDAAGSCVAYLSGPYRIEVHDANGALVYDADQLNSIAVETPAGNPGSLIAANNLSDLDSPAVARASLGLEKQTGTQDTTDGRVMLVGAFGTGGNAPAITVTAGALDSTSRATGYVRVEAGDVATVGGPSGAGAGIVHTMKSPVGLAQVYYPVSGSNPAPWRRINALGTWTAWLRDFESGTEATGDWKRDASGMQHCWIRGVTFTPDAAKLKYTWTYPKPFSANPTVIPTLPVSNANYTGVDQKDIQHGFTASGTTIASIYFWPSPGSDTFTTGDQVANVDLYAVGPWQ